MGRKSIQILDTANTVLSLCCLTLLYVLIIGLNHNVHHTNNDTMSHNYKYVTNLRLQTKTVSFCTILCCRVS